MGAGLVERLGIEVPIVQAPLGGGFSSPELAAAVSNAGGLGTIGIRSPAALRRDFAQARSLANGRPVGIGLLVSFTRRAHVDAVLASKPSAVLLMAGFRSALVRSLHEAGIFVFHQVGSRSDAERALRDGADALIAQGVEAGGHVLGEERAEVLLPQVLACAAGRPVLVAGGIATADDVAHALAQGAAGVVVGTRYLLTPEAAAHAAYKQRILGAQRTLLTTLFGVGWSLKHRVVPNAATERFCDANGRIPGWVSLLQRVIDPLAQPFAMMRDGTGSGARSFNLLPLFTPDAPRMHQPASAVEHAALYAGESAARIHSIDGAFDVTKQLAQALVRPRGDGELTNA
jgi:NAD(P)H-dependent flavin oxidoreductase YrpB (nitropropane dioxygenase family)